MHLASARDAPQRLAATPPAMLCRLKAAATCTCRLTRSSTTIGRPEAAPFLAQRRAPWSTRFPHPPGTMSAFKRAASLRSNPILFISRFRQSVMLGIMVRPTLQKSTLQPSSRSPTVRAAGELRDRLCSNSCTHGKHIASSTGSGYVSKNVCRAAACPSQSCRPSLPDPGHHRAHSVSRWLLSEYAWQSRVPRVPGGAELRCSCDRVHRLRPWLLSPACILPCV